MNLLHLRGHVVKPMEDIVNIIMQLYSTSLPKQIPAKAWLFGPDEMITDEEKVNYLSH